MYTERMMRENERERMQLLDNNQVKRHLHKKIFVSNFIFWSFQYRGLQLKSMPSLKEVNQNHQDASKGNGKSGLNHLLSNFPCNPILITQHSIQFLTLLILNFTGDMIEYLIGYTA